jgi:hypothetical protein
MRSTNAVRAVVVCGSVMLAACQDGGVTAPKDVVNPQFAALSASWCGGAQQTRNSLSAGAQSAGFGLPFVSVISTFRGWGVPWGLVQQMNFAGGLNGPRPECFNTSGETYVTVPGDPSQSDPAPLPVPDDVDSDWWYSLTPREQRTLMALAQKMMEQYPGAYGNIGAAINALRGKVIQPKLTGRIRAADFYGPAPEGDMMAGGIYGCLLFRSFALDPSWFLDNQSTLSFVSDMVTAFAESHYNARPLRAIQFARNGAMGAVLAAGDSFSRDCGAMIFEAIGNRRILVDDPYTRGGSPSPLTPPEYDQ